MQQRILQALLQVLPSLTNALGVAVVAFAFHAYLTRMSPVGLYVALAIVVAGPVEGLLTAWIRRSPRFDLYREEYLELVDQLTSLAFVVALGLAVYHGAVLVGH